MNTQENQPSNTTPEQAKDLGHIAVQHETDPSWDEKFGLSKNPQGRVPNPTIKVVPIGHDRELNPPTHTPDIKTV